MRLSSCAPVAKKPSNYRHYFTTSIRIRIRLSRLRGLPADEPDDRRQRHRQTERQGEARPAQDRRPRYAQRQRQTARARPRYTVAVSRPSSNRGIAPELLLSHIESLREAAGGRPFFAVSAANCKSMRAKWLTRRHGDK